MIIRYFIQLLLIFLCTAPMVQGDDLGDVQNSFETTIRAFNTGNRDAFISSSHTDVVVYGALSAEATRGKEAFQQLIRDFVAAHGAIHFTPVNPAFRVAGTSALAWGHYIQRSTDQTGVQENFNGRYTFTYTKTDTGWKLVALYFSPLELSPSEAAAAAQTAAASDLSAIQTSFGTTINAFNTGNMGAFTASSHTDVVVYGALSAEATRGKEAFQQLIRDFVAAHGAIHFTPVNPAFRVAGTSALAWGHYIQRSTDQTGVQENFNGRYTFTYTKTDTGWKLVALYFSPLLSDLSAIQTSFEQRSTPLIQGTWAPLLLLRIRMSSCMAPCRRRRLGAKKPSSSSSGTLSPRMGQSTSHPSIPPSA